MKEILNSVTKTVKNRLTNSLYGTFFVSWLIFHWNFVFTIFFVDQDIVWKSKMLFKNDYLLQEFFNTNNLYFWISWLAPFLVTYLAIWILPKYILLPAFIEEQDYEFIKKKYEIEKQKELIGETTKLEKAEIEKLDTVVEKIEKQQEVKTKKDPKEEWDQEILDFKKIGYGPKFLAFLEKWYAGYRSPSAYQGGDLSYFDALELININKDGIIDGLTEKGKYFTRKVKINAY